MFEDHPQAGERLRERDQLALDEHLLPVKNIDVGIDDFAVNEERHVDLLHALQHARDMLEVRHAGGRVGGGIRRIKLDAGEHPLAKAALDVVGIGVVAQIAGHQRREGRTRRPGRERPFAIGDGVGRGRDRRYEVRHQDGAAEMACGERQGRPQHGAIAHMQMPVVRLANGDTRRHQMIPSYPRTRGT